jgi:hypothetical protein
MSTVPATTPELLATDTPLPAIAGTAEVEASPQPVATSTAKTPATIAPTATVAEAVTRAAAEETLAGQVDVSRLMADVRWLADDAR